MKVLSLSILVHRVCDLRLVAALESCSKCSLRDNLWLCLECGFVACGRPRCFLARFLELDLQIRSSDQVSGNSHHLAHRELTGHALAVDVEAYESFEIDIREGARLLCSLYMHG